MELIIILLLGLCVIVLVVGILDLYSRLEELEDRIDLVRYTVSSALFVYDTFLPFGPVDEGQPDEGDIYQ